jgi:hypothetical protein
MYIYIHVYVYIMYMYGTDMAITLSLMSLQTTRQDWIVIALIAP